MNSPGPVSKPPQVTAVIPTRNRPDLVLRSVRSVLAQTYSAVDVIVVIDGEDQATRAVLQKLSDPRVHVTPLRESVGAAEARNIGVRQAAGEWIAFLDDDDEWLPEKIEKQMRLAGDLKCEFPIISCRLRVQTPSREYVWPRRLPAPREPVSEYVLARRGLFQGEGVVSTITLLVPRRLLLRVPFQPEQRRHQEWDWIFRAVHQAGAELCFVDEPLAVWHLEEGHPGISAMNQWRYSYDWIERVRSLVTPRAYAAFLLTVVAAIAARSGERRACWTLLKEALLKGRPAVIDLFLFCGMVAIPQGYRRRLRSLFSV
jgi:glycosyltransferase involved in cell wall biosynthesis